MKKTIFTLMILAFVASVTTYAQSDRKFQKEMSKVYKKKTKDLKKEGWKISGSSLTLEAAVMKHLRTLSNDEQKWEIIGEVSRCESVNLGKQHAFNNAAISYANSARSYIHGKIAAELSNDAASSIPNGIDNFYAAYERALKAEIIGSLHGSFSLVKNNENYKSYQTWFIVDEEAASQARMRAAKLALTETNIKQVHARKITEFAREGVTASE